MGLGSNLSDERKNYLDSRPVIPEPILRKTQGLVWTGPQVPSPGPLPFSSRHCTLVLTPECLPLDPQKIYKMVSQLSASKSSNVAHSAVEVMVFQSRR